MLFLLYKPIQLCSLHVSENSVQAGMTCFPGPLALDKMSGTDF